MSNNFKIATGLLVISFLLPFAIEAGDEQKQQLKSYAEEKPELFEDVDLEKISVGYAWLFELCARDVIC